MPYATNISRGAQRAPEIDVRESEHVRLWCPLRTTRNHQLFCAVSTVGGQVDNIKRHLRRAVPASR